MTIELTRWQMTSPNHPMECSTVDFDPSTLPPGRVLVDVAGCGVCHTDLGFLYDGVRTRHATSTACPTSMRLPPSLATT